MKDNAASIKNATKIVRSLRAIAIYKKNQKRVKKLDTFISASAFVLLTAQIDFTRKIDLRQKTRDYKLFSHIAIVLYLVEL